MPKYRLTGEAMPGALLISSLAAAKLNAGDVDGAIALLGVDCPPVRVREPSTAFVGKAGGDRKWRDRLIAGRA